MSGGETFEDWRGNVVVAGATIAYPRVSGRSCEIREGEVVEIIRHEKDRFECYRNAEGAIVREYVPAYKVKVRTTGRSSRRFYGGQAGKVVTLQIGENVTVIAP